MHWKLDFCPDQPGRKESNAPKLKIITKVLLTNLYTGLVSVSATVKSPCF